MLRLARENDWGSERIEGELRKLRYENGKKYPALLRYPSVPERGRNVLGGIIHDYYRDAAQTEIRVSMRFFEGTRPRSI